MRTIAAAVMMVGLLAGVTSAARAAEPGWSGQVTIAASYHHSSAQYGTVNEKARSTWTFRADAVQFDSGPDANSRTWTQVATHESSYEFVATSPPSQSCASQQTKKGAGSGSMLIDIKIGTYADPFPDPASGVLVGPGNNPISAFEVPASVTYADCDSSETQQTTASICTPSIGFQPRYVSAPDGTMTETLSGTVSISGGPGGSGQAVGCHSGFDTGTLTYYLTRKAVPVKCANGGDDDGDGLVDMADPGCVASDDADEIGTAGCDNGRDDDSDGRTDRTDPDCVSSTDQTEGADIPAGPLAGGPGTSPPTLPPEPPLREATCRAAGHAGDAIGLRDTIRTVRGIAAERLGVPGAALSIVSYACTLKDLPGVTTGRNTVATSACTALTTFSTGVGLGSLGLAATGAGLPAAGVGGMISFGTSLIAKYPCGYSSSRTTSRSRPTFRAVAATPAYRKIASSVPLTIPVPKRPAGVSSQVWTTLKSLLRTSGTMVGHGAALRSCMDRAVAAAAARDAAWTARQRACAAVNAKKLAAGYRTHKRLRLRVAREVKTARMRDRPLSVAVVRKSLTTLAASMRTQLGAMGASAAEVDALQRQTVAQAARVKVPSTLFGAIAGKASLAPLDAAAGVFNRIARDYAKR